jgi:hypothetical protein
MTNDERQADEMVFDIPRWMKRNGWMNTLCRCGHGVRHHSHWRFACERCNCKGVTVW